MDRPATRPPGYPAVPMACASCGRAVPPRTVMMTTTRAVYIACDERTRTAGGAARTGPAR